MPTKEPAPVSAEKKTGESEAEWQVASGKSAVIDRKMRVADILTLLPDSAPLIAQYGLSCFSCAANEHENLEDGCRTHGMPEAEIDDLVTDLNEMLRDKPVRPQMLTLTDAAAIALKDLMLNEGKAGWGLKVGLDDGGGFCMEFAKDASGDEKIFKNTVEDVTLFASPLTLASIGGSTIDLRDGRFKLDLPEDTQKKECGCGGGGACGCGGNCGCS